MAALSATPTVIPAASETYTTADATFVADFRCPESYMNSRALANSYPTFDKWVIGHHPKWTLGELLEFRYALLKLHDCTQTLKNIRRNAGLPEHSGGMYVATSILPITIYTSDCIRPKVRQLSRFDIVQISSIAELRDAAELQPESLRELQGKARAGNHIAQFYLATLYDPSLKTSIHTVTRAWKSANAWYLRAAEAGLPEAEVSVGNAYANGDGALKNDEQAVYWYRRAAQHGYVDAAWNMGVAYDYGRGISADESKALQWYCAAALEGDQQSQWHLAAVSYKKKASAGNLDKTIYWLSILQREGDAGAAILLGIIQSTDVM